VNIDDAKARVAAQDAELAQVEAEIARLAQAHVVPVFLAMLRMLVEMMCAAQGDVFRNHYKLKFYQGVMEMLRRKGIS
jgi:hypothetical protein